jgi:hypothetical protein
MHTILVCLKIISSVSLIHSISDALSVKTNTFDYTAVANASDCRTLEFVLEGRPQKVRVAGQGSHFASVIPLSLPHLRPHVFQQHVLVLAVLIPFEPIRSSSSLVTRYPRLPGKSGVRLLCYQALRSK